MVVQVSKFSGCRYIAQKKWNLNIDAERSMFRNIDSPAVCRVARVASTLIALYLAIWGGRTVSKPPTSIIKSTMNHPSLALVNHY